MTESAAATKEVVGSIAPAPPITVSFSKTFTALLAKIDTDYTKERGEVVRDEFEGLKLDPALGWQIDFNAKAWIGRTPDTAPPA